ncbi:MAG TPA: 4'-phosphopantetheinyl transferase superfamily protein [Burkholderiales bacterium]|nr:4'-phosphopantetheinyl transferase superfamily protein [Burkholderiales bacterium]
MKGLIPTLSGDIDAGLLPVSPGKLYLWILPMDCGSESQAQALSCVLSSDEKDEAACRANDHDRRQFVISRALTRLALSRHFPVAPEGWRFGRDGNARPFVRSPSMLPQARFSVSHTHGMAACLVTLSKDAAVDVEKISHFPDLRAVAAEFLSPAELDRLNACVDGEWTERFYAYWTLKEAYAKARGMGLKLPFSDIELHFDGTRDIKLLCPARMDANGGAWKFWRCMEFPPFAIAVAAKAGAVADFELVCNELHTNGTELAVSLTTH